MIATPVRSEIRRILTLRKRNILTFKAYSHVLRTAIWDEHGRFRIVLPNEIKEITIFYSTFELDPEERDLLRAMHDAFVSLFVIFPRTENTPASLEHICDRLGYYHGPRTDVLKEKARFLRYILSKRRQRRVSA